jgi:hypothetical protein
MRTPPAAPATPSQVLPGLIRGASLCRPSACPAKYAAASAIQTSPSTSSSWTRVSDSAASPASTSASAPATASGQRPACADARAQPGGATTSQKGSASASSAMRSRAADSSARIEHCIQRADDDRVERRRTGVIAGQAAPLPARQHEDEADQRGKQVPLEKEERGEKRAEQHAAVSRRRGRPSGVRTGSRGRRAAGLPPAARWCGRSAARAVHRRRSRHRARRRRSPATAYR